MNKRQRKKQLKKQYQNDFYSFLIGKLSLTDLSKKHSNDDYIKSLNTFFNVYDSFVSYCEKTSLNNFLKHK